MLLTEIASATKFKALFIAGPPASGKSFIYKNMNFPPHEYLNTDDLRHSEAQRLKVDLKDLNAERQIFDGVLDSTAVFLFNHTIVGNNLIIETTADLKHNFFKRVRTLQSLGYDVAVIYTHITKEQSLELEKKRREQEGRAVDPAFIEKVYSDMPTRLPEIADLIGNSNMLYVPRTSIDYTQNDQQRIRSFITTFFKTPNNNPKGKRLAAEIERDPSGTMMKIDNEDVFQLYNLFLGWFDK